MKLINWYTIKKILMKPFCLIGLHKKVKPRFGVYNLEYGVPKKVCKYCKKEFGYW